jgi:hypothetical protein
MPDEVSLDRIPLANPPRGIDDPQGKSAGGASLELIVVRRGEGRCEVRVHSRLLSLSKLVGSVAHRWALDSSLRA